MIRLAAREPRGDTPGSLPLRDIREAHDLFQPRHGSIAYAPGRSEGHIAALARTAKAGTELDPVTVAAFGNDWYLLDGHHRLAAYREVDWAKPIPVHALQSGLRGKERVEWAIERSYADNKKDRLNLSGEDKMDGAWRAVAHGAELSVAHTALAYGVSGRTVANMRKARRALEAAGGHPELMHGWSMAQGELRHLNGKDMGSSDFAERQRREAAKRLKSVMDMHLSPGDLAEALEAFSPGIVEAMALARAGSGDDDDEGDASWGGLDG